MINWIGWDKAGRFRQGMMNPVVGMRLRHSIETGDYQVTDVDWAANEMTVEEIAPDGSSRGRCRRVRITVKWTAIRQADEIE